MKCVTQFAIAVAAMCVAGVVSAQQVKPEDAIQYRQGVMRAVGWNFGPMGAMVKGERPFDRTFFARNAKRLAALSEMPLEGFVPGTESGDTRAKPEIWLDWDKYKASMERMGKASTKLAEVAVSGDEKAIKAQFGETAKTCKSCHDDFRKSKK